MSDVEIVVVKTFITKVDADLAKGALEAHGIDAIVRTDDIGGTRPHLWMGGVELLVRSTDQDEARKILGDE